MPFTTTLTNLAQLLATSGEIIAGREDQSIAGSRLECYDSKIGSDEVYFRNAKKERFGPFSLSAPVTIDIHGRTTIMSVGGFAWTFLFTPKHPTTTLRKALATGAQVTAIYKHKSVEIEQEYGIEWNDLRGDKNFFEFTTTMGDSLGEFFLDQALVLDQDGLAEVKNTEEEKIKLRFCVRIPLTMEQLIEAKP